MAARVNRDYFEHKSVPPLALLISGNKGLTPDEVSAKGTRTRSEHRSPMAAAYPKNSCDV